MNTHDVSDVPQYAQFLNQQRRSLRDAQSRKGQRPGAKKSRDERVMQFSFRLMAKQAMTNADTVNMRPSFVLPAYPPCIRSFKDLKKVAIKDLLLETHHRGTYLLLRSITPPDRMTAVMSIVEDENKDALMLQLYHQEEENERPADDILPEGTVLVVKEPYLKLMSDGDHGLRIDHPSDIIHLPSHDDRVPTCWQPRRKEKSLTASAWKKKGNNRFDESKYHAAIRHYTRGLDCSPTVEEADALRINRSLAFINTGRFDDALSDLESGSGSPNLAEKALFRKAYALYCLQSWRECCDVLKVLCLEYPSNVSAKAQFKRALGRLAEEENGRYRFKQLYTEAAKLRPPHLDHSTYVGPVAVRESGSRGRGLFTTEAVKAGDPLLCEKAFAHAYVDAEDPGQCQDLSLLIEAETDSMKMGAQASLIRMITQKIYRNPSLASVITDLHHGSYEPVGGTDADGTPVVDSFLIGRIVSLNCFGCPLSTRESQLRAMKDDPSKKKEEGKFHPCGIWPTASYINHCCDSNACRAFIADMMVVRATQDLPPDTEITFWYQMPVPDRYAKHQTKLRPWNFKCDCAICMDDRTTHGNVLAKRESLRAEAMGHIQSPKSTSTTNIATILAAMTDTYSQPAFKVPRLSMWEPQLDLARMYLKQSLSGKAIEPALGTLAALGYVIEGGTLPRATRTPMVIKKWGLFVDYLIDCWMLLSDAYFFSGAFDLEAQAEKYAKIAYKISLGENATFDETVEDLVYPV